jgi:hypothetical protein
MEKDIGVHFNFDKNWLGYMFGDLLILNSYCHPGSNAVRDEYYKAFSVIIRNKNKHLLLSDLDFFFSNV